MKWLLEKLVKIKETAAWWWHRQSFWKLLWSYVSKPAILQVIWHVFPELIVKKRKICQILFWISREETISLAKKLVKKTCQIVNVRKSRKKICCPGFFQKTISLGQFSVHKIAPAFIFGRIQDAIICFCDLLTFRWGNYSRSET